MLTIGAVVLVAIAWPHAAQAPNETLEATTVAALVSLDKQQHGGLLDGPSLPAGSAPSGAARKSAVRTLVIGSNQQVLINLDRRSAGLGPLSWSTCLAGVAVANARRMAAQGYISHTNGAWLDLDCHLGVQGGENVGWWSGGITDGQLNSMFMASPEHRANIMGPYHFVATAWAVAANGFAYIAVEFG